MVVRRESGGAYGQHREYFRRASHDAELRRIRNSQLSRGMAMRLRIALVLAAIAITTACSERTLSAERAGSLIAALDGFRRDAHFTIATGLPFQSLSRCLSQNEIEQRRLNEFVLKQGWVRYESREAFVGFGTKASCTAFALTPGGMAASAQWAKGRSASGQGIVWIVPIGRRELVRVTKLTAAPDGSTQVEFDWKWTPNDTGVARQMATPNASTFFAQTKKSRASCRRADDRWRCVLAP